MEENLHDLGFGNKFLDETPKAQSMQQKNNKLDIIKIKNDCSVKVTARRIKR